MTKGQPLADERHEAFAQAVARGTPAAQAHTEAGFPAKSRRAAALQALRLKDVPEVFQRIEELRPPAEILQDISPARPTLEQAMIALMQAQSAMCAAQTSMCTAIAAYITMASTTAMVVSDATPPSPAHPARVTAPRPPPTPPPVEFEPLPTPAARSPRRDTLKATPQRSVQQAVPQQVADLTDLPPTEDEDFVEAAPDFGLGAMQQEFADMQAEEDLPPPPPDEIDVWVKRIDTWKQTKMWMPNWGPTPGQQGFRGGEALA